MLMKKFAALVICCVFATAAVGQDKINTPAAKEVPAAATAKTVTPKAQPVAKVMLNKDGALEGKALLDQTKQAIAKTKVTLSAEGKVVDTVQADENGAFTFASVAPGAYQVLGSSDGFVGSSSYDVVPYAQPAIGGCSSCSVGMASAPSEVIYDNYASQPVSSFSSCGACNSPCNTCGGGLGGGRIGGGLGSRLGGGLLSNGRIGLIGLAGLAGLGGDDSSPDR